MKDELNSDVLEESIGVRPKMYALKRISMAKKDDSIKKKRKCVKKYVLDTKLYT